MSFCLRIGVLLLLVTGTLTEDGFDLSDALDDLVPPTDKPQKQPKAPEKPISDGGLDLLDALGPDEPVKPKKPSSGDSGGFGFDLTDALGPDPNPKPEQPAVKPPSGGGGGGNFGDSDLFDIGGGEYKPDGDPDLLWGQILKTLNANMPEEFYIWMSNVKQMLTPLLERAMDLLHAFP
ncbi:CD99 molecule isoform X4 [Pseudoliparis swirei]|uniref:CD99 molecule isoform X4 n=1 Tax=Pseudoliparis swirei TaxID=2059687 RepID=UPI0024BE5AA3|nr:CD99 molecule isoform X4 [Pseudoliparis swirei]